MIFPSRRGAGLNALRTAAVVNLAKSPALGLLIILAQKFGLYPSNEDQRRLLSEDEWKEIKVASTNREDFLNPCVICKEQFGLEDQVLLSCSHVFHRVSTVRFGGELTESNVTPSWNSLSGVTIGACEGSRWSDLNREVTWFVSNSCSICLCERLDSADKIKVTLQTYVFHLLVSNNEANRSHRCSQGRLRPPNF